MAKSGKRSAEQAFDQVQPEDPRAEKRRKRKKDRKARAAAKAEEADGEVGNHDHNANGDSGGQAGDEADVNLGETAQPDTVSHAGLSKKKRQKQWKDKTAPPTPKKDKQPPAPAETVEENVVEREDPAESTSNAKRSKKSEKKIRRKQSQNWKAEDNARVSREDNEEANEDASEDGLVEIQARIQAQSIDAATMETRPIESEKEARRRAKKERKTLQQQANNDAEEENGVQPQLQATDATTLGAHPVESEKDARRRAKKERKRLLQQANNEAASDDNGDQSQAQPTEVTTLGDHPVESAKEAKRQEKKERKRLRQQLNSQLGGVDDSSKIEDESMLDHVNADDSAQRPDDTVPDLTGPPLQDRIESPTSVKKKKKRSRKRASDAVAKNEGRVSEELGNGTVMEVDQDSPEVTSAPLELRIQVPDEARNTQKETAIGNGDALSADDSADDQALVEVPYEYNGPGMNQKQLKRLHRRMDRRQGDSWSIAEGTGGIFIDHDPILADDLDEVLILPTRSEVRIHARSTSLLRRTFHNEDPGHIVSCALLISNPMLLLIGTSKGFISLIDILDGKIQFSGFAADGLKQILPLNDAVTMSFLSVHCSKKQCSIKAFCFSSKDDQALEMGTVLTHNNLGAVQFLEQAGIILTFARSQMLIGHCLNLDPLELTNESFTWRELTLPSKIVSFDTHVGPSVGKRRLARIDLAVGLVSGDILIYEDILFKLIGKEKDVNSLDIEPRTLSWHRGPVNTVKWTPDGNYIISGGKETTLVIWQLDTNSKQFLPHLSSPILNLSVSDDGSAYALRLADNSVMILGTANRTPETNVSGPAAPSTGRLIASLHPTATDQLLLACPPDALLPLINEDRNNSLQTFDVSAGIQLGRQALTRNLTTVVNVDPVGRPIREPTVSQLQISADGTWLATIDEWEPPIYDLDATYLPEEREARKENLEIRLRIWSRNDDEGDWELNTRVDEPNSIARILSLSSNPARIEFAAVGADGIIRIWQPRARVRDGVKVRDAQGKQLYTWTCVNTVSVPIQGEEEALTATMAYSDDGSTLAVSLELNEQYLPLTHLLDARMGELVESVPDLVTEGESCLVFAGRNLIALSKTICIYDVVDSQVVATQQLSEDFTKVGSSRFLAVDRVHMTVAIGLNKSAKHGGFLTILDTNNLVDGAVFEGKTAGRIRAVLTSPSTSGFTVIDEYSQIMPVKPPFEFRAPDNPGAMEPQEVARGLDRIFGKGQALNGGVNGTATKMLINGETEQDQIAGQTLEKLLAFDTSASAPGVDDLFDKVAGTFAKSAPA